MIIRVIIIINNIIVTALLCREVGNVFVTSVAASACLFVCLSVCLCVYVSIRALTFEADRIETFLLAQW